MIKGGVMTHEPQAHGIQIDIMRHLLFKPTATFSDLQRQPTLQVIISIFILEN